MMMSSMTAHSAKAIACGVLMVVEYAEIPNPRFISSFDCSAI